MTSSRFQYIELRKSSVLQLIFFFAVFLAVASISFRVLIIPLAESVFEDSFKARVIKEGENLNQWTNWKVETEPARVSKNNSYGNEEESKTYFFDPVLATLPLVLAAGAFIAVIASSVVSIRLGLIRQKIEREIINALHAYARIEYGEHTENDLTELSDTIRRADIHKLHELEEHWHTSVSDLEIVQAAIVWRHRSLVGRIVHLLDAIALYMRNHFTVRYENPVLGMIYIGAAVLIIIIGLRGLQFIPKDSPSLVLFAICLEFILLIVYAATLMYTKASEEEESDGGASDLASMFASGSGASSQQAEKLLRMFSSQPPR